MLIPSILVRNSTVPWRMSLIFTGTFIHPADSDGWAVPWDDKYVTDCTCITFRSPAPRNVFPAGAVDESLLSVSHHNSAELLYDQSPILGPFPKTWLKHSLESQKSKTLDKVVLHGSILQAWSMTLVRHFCLSMKYFWWKFSSGATHIHVLCNKRGIFFSFISLETMKLWNRTTKALHFFGKHSLAGFLNWWSLNNSKNQRKEWIGLWQFFSHFLDTLVYFQLTP